MKDLIQIQKNEIGTEKVNAVNSREIYEYLGVKEQYSDWMKRAVNKYDFIENEDYIITIQKNLNSQFSGLKERKDYIVTLDMAKELCMVSNTLKGKETRKYFIECEKELYFKPKTLSLEDLLKENTKMITNLQDKVISLNNVIQEQKPKVAFANSVSASNDSILIGTFAKAISTEDFTIGQKRLFAYLRDKGYLMSFGQAYNQPLQKYIDNGYFEVCERTILNPDGSVRIALTIKITGRGQVALAKKLREDFSPRVPCTRSIGIGA